MDRASDYIERGLGRARAEQWQAAADLFRRAVDADRANADAAFRLGWALWRQAQAAKPTLADLGIGYVAQMAGVEAVAKARARKFAVHKRLLFEAAHWLREALSRRPEHADTLHYLAHCLSDLGYKDDAAKLARRASEIDPDNVTFRNLASSIAGTGVAEPARPRAEHPAKLPGWDDVVLDARTKRELRQVQLMLEKPAMARELGVDPPTGILLKGAPGTGKTTVARVLAAEAKCRFFSISPADINQMYVGESEKRVNDLFVQARRDAPSIIFIDEIDALLPARQGGVAVHYDKVVNQFLQEMDGMTANERVLVIGATNREDMLDPALRRGGRLSREIEIPLPDARAREALLRLFTKGVRIAQDVDVCELAAASEGWSGADLRALVNEAGLQALIRIADSEAAAERTVTALDFTEALRSMTDR